MDGDNRPTCDGDCRDDDIRLHLGQIMTVMDLFIVMIAMTMTVWFMSEMHIKIRRQDI